MNGLMLHTGAATANYEQVAAVETPAAEGEWNPIPHVILLDTVKTELLTSGFRITEESFGLWQDGARFFGLLKLSTTGKDGDYSTVVGLRNSHDKAFAATVGMGSYVFVCDNLAFSADIKLARKHTTNILRDLPGLTNRAITKLSDFRGFQDNRIEAYKNWEVTEVMAHDFIIRLVMNGVVPPTKVPALVEEWRKPRHEEFAPRTAWSLFNCVTEILKGAFTALPRRTMTMHGMMDAMTGVVQPTRLNEEIGEIPEAEYEVIEAVRAAA